MVLVEVVVVQMATVAFPVELAYQDKVTMEVQVAFVPTSLEEEVEVQTVVVVTPTVVELKHHQ